MKNINSVVKISTFVFLAFFALGSSFVVANHNNGHSQGGGNTVTICHNGQTLNVNENALGSYAGFTMGACVVVPPSVPGCMNPLATNYNPAATVDNGSCILPPPSIPGCMNEEATNYNPEATEDNGSCVFPETPEPQVTICHNGMTQSVDESALEAHLEHGDTEGACTIDEVDETAPNAPVHVSPADGSVLTTAEVTILDWTTVTDESEPVVYYYESSLSEGLNEDGSFVSPIYQSGALSSSEINAAGTPEGTYYWHVRAVDDEGNSSAWTSAWELIVSNTTEEETIFGCMNPEATNYNPEATESDESCVFDENEEENDNEEVVEEEEERRRPGQKRLLGSVLGAFTNGGEVLGASTGICEMYITDYMKEGGNNNSEQVSKLQSFLTEQGFSVPTTGFFGSMTTAAVKQFQSAHANEVLQPWVDAGLAADLTPTGVVFKTTRYKINNIVCEGAEPMPVL